MPCPSCDWSMNWTIVCGREPCMKCTSIGLSALSKCLTPTISTFLLVSYSSVKINNRSIVDDKKETDSITHSWVEKKTQQNSIWLSLFVSTSIIDEVNTFATNIAPNVRWLLFLRNAQRLCKAQTKARQHENHYDILHGYGFKIAQHRCRSSPNLAQDCYDYRFFDGIFIPFRQ